MRSPSTWDTRVKVVAMVEEVEEEEKEEVKEEEKEEVEEEEKEELEE